MSVKQDQLSGGLKTGHDKKCNIMDKKFSDLVKDSINKDELSNIKGGFGPEDFTPGPSNPNMHACDSFACSSNTKAASPFCTKGDGVCDKHIA